MESSKNDFKKKRVKGEFYDFFISEARKNLFGNNFNFLLF